MSAIRDIMNIIKIDQPTLQATVGKYLDHLEETDGEQVFEIKRDLGDSPSFAESTYRAAADGITLSTLAVSLDNDSDYEEALGTVKQLSDPFLTKIRRDLFVQSLTVAAHNMALDGADLDSVKRRSAMTEPYLN